MGEQSQKKCQKYDMVLEKVKKKCNTSSALQRG